MKCKKENRDEQNFIKIDLLNIDLSICKISNTQIWQ